MAAERPSKHPTEGPPDNPAPDGYLAGGPWLRDGVGVGVRVWSGPG